MPKKKEPSPLTGHFLTIGGRLYDSYQSAIKNFDTDGKELMKQKRKELGDFIWLHSKLVVRPKDQRLAPYYKYGRFPGETKEQQMRYLHDTEGMTVEEKVQWLEEQGYPKYGRKASTTNTKGRRT